MVEEMKKPIVSVIMPSYNHEAYVVSAVKSVLAQSFSDFEFLISDDGSVDKTASVIKTINDPRIKFFENKNNRGACIVTNELITMSQGKYVALINSDDAWVSTKLEKQVAYMERYPDVGACFSRAQWMDKSGVEIPDRKLEHGQVFNQKNRSQAMWLRRFLFLRNCLCHPSILIRKQIYDHIGLYDNRLRQLPDFEMWIRLVKNYPIHIMDEKLINFRVLPGENASSATSENVQRIRNELYFIFQSFFDDVSESFLKEGFSDILRNKNFSSKEELDIEKMLLYFSSGFWDEQIYKLIGLEKMHQLLVDPKVSAVLWKSYEIDDREFQKISGETNTLTRFIGSEASGSNNQSELLETISGKILLKHALSRVPKKLKQLIRH